MAKTQQPWQDKWDIIKSLNGGGQCDNFLVHSTDSNIEGDFVLKVIKNASSLERRTRFYREVHHYIAINHPRIPKIVDHNCDETPHREKRLYFVYHYIDGTNLENYILNNGTVSLTDGVHLVIQLAEILKYCHDEGVIHRDIKPDNIILRNDDINDSILIDFGLSAKHSDVVLPESGQMQLGNRFLYLPELKDNSEDKRDKRSDITYLVGVLFFVLTAKYPFHFLDENQKYPHQRIPLEEIIKGAEEIKINMLRRFFDKGFQFLLNRRFQSINELDELLLAITNVKEETGGDYKAFIMSTADASKGDLVQDLTDMYPIIRKYFSEIPQRNKFPNISFGISGPTVLPHWDPICIAGHYYITEKYERKITQTYMFKVYPNGIEYILSIFIKKEEFIVLRFQNISELDENTTQKMEDFIWNNFATLLRKK